MPNPSRGHVVVIGSINMDLVCRSATIPRPGETVLGSDVATVPGGKGANQAVAVAKLDAPVHMIGRVGDDDFGQRLLNGLSQHHVDTTFVTVTEGVSSGVALIVVDRRGENAIVVAPGANHKLTPADIDVAEPIIRGAAAVVMQLEIPLATVRHAIALCRKLDVYTILDPAPVPPKGLSRALMGVDLLTPNTTEAQLLLGLKRDGRKVHIADPKQIAGELLDRGARSVVLKRGSKGAIAVTRDGTFLTVKPLRVRVVDTTAAGDAFTAALAVARAQEMSLENTLHFANAAGAACCTSFGAQPSLPSRATVQKLLSRSGR